LRIELLIEEKLIMVSTSRTARLPRPDIYIYLDWGSEFALQHGMAFADLSNSGVTVGLGPLGLDYLLAAGALATSGWTYCGLVSHQAGCIGSQIHCLPRPQCWCWTGARSPFCLWAFEPVSELWARASDRSSCNPNGLGIFEFA